jgi:hypothetical protein
MTVATWMCKVEKDDTARIFTRGVVWDLDPDKDGMRAFKILFFTLRCSDRVAVQMSWSSRITAIHTYLFDGSQADA